MNYHGCRRWSAWVLVTACLLAALTSGCGGNTAQQAESGSVQATTSAVSPADRAAERARIWQQILADPGLPGRDYIPGRLTVSYFPAAQMSNQLPALKPAQGQRAADQGNPMLRSRQQFEPLTDSIAAQYGLRICNQVYTGATNIAGFILPEGADGDAIIQAIRRRYGTVVEWVTYSRRYELDYTPNDPDFQASDDVSGLQWNVHKVNCEPAWDTTLGDPDVWIAVIDTGANLQHEELAGQVFDPAIMFPAATCDVINQDNEVDDTEGHGSGTASLAVAAGNDGITMTGVAPACHVIPIKISNDGFDIADASVVEAGYLAQSLGAKIISMSFGGGAPDPATATMCAELNAAGLLLCASAGNEDSNLDFYPAAYPGCFSIGASNIDDARISHAGWWGSNYSASVAICAPGEDYEAASYGAADAYQDFGGTSGACPQVAACAALVWSQFPAWTNDQLREALIATGAPTTGFEHDVPRVDIGALFEMYGRSFNVAPPNVLLNHGQITLTANVFGEVDAIQSLFNGQPGQILTAGPWDFTFDTSSVEFGPANFEFQGTGGGDPIVKQLSLLIDNSPAVFPLSEDFENGGGNVRSVDARFSSQAILNQLYLLTPVAPAKKIQNQGPGLWQGSQSAAFEGSGSWYCGLPAQDAYGGYELDCLLSRRLDLTEVTAPSLVFHHHYNIEDGGVQFDRAYVMVSADDGATWDIAERQDHTLALYSGNQQDWSTESIDLSDYGGQLVYLAFVFESDESYSGEDPLAPGGWWIDKITVSTGYSETLPGFETCSITPGAVFGSVPARSALEVSVAGLNAVEKVSYELDLAPFNQAGTNDSAADGSGADFAATLNVPTAVRNQQAILRVRCFGAGDEPGLVQSIPVFIFNLAGDANADNAVDQSDSDAISAAIGESPGTPGFVPFLDSDMDGQITEADAAAVGYFWGGSL